MVAGHGQVLPDREVLPRRGPARRPPAGIHPDRLRDGFITQEEVLATFKGLTKHLFKTVSGIELPGLPAHDVRRGHAPLRLRQA